MTILTHVSSMVGDTLGGEIVTDSIADSFLKIGIKEVISNILKFNPKSGTLFYVESDEQTENGFHVDSGIIYSVLREDGTDEQWRACRQVDISNQYLITDTDSMFFASKFNPVFIRDANNNVNVYPVPTTSNQAYKVIHLKYPELDNNGNALSSATDIDNVGISNFPGTFHPHLVTYIASQCLKSYYNSLVIIEEDVELANSISKSIELLERKYVQLFISKNLIEAQEEGAPKQRQERRQA